MTENNPFQAPGEPSTPIPEPSSPSEPQLIDKVFPHRNLPALASYYLGIFSLIPLIGFLLSMISIFLGIKGLKKVKSEPKVSGKTHAYLGIGCSTPTFLFWSIVVLGIFMAKSTWQEPN